MTRRRWIYPGNGQEPFEVTADYAPEPMGVLIVGDLPGYQSPATGLWVEGRAARREDLKRSGCRPYEGIAQEKKEAARHQQYQDKRLDASLTKTASEAFYQMSPQKRRLLERA